MAGRYACSTPLPGGARLGSHTDAMEMSTTFCGRAGQQVTVIQLCGVRWQCATMGWLQAVQACELAGMGWNRRHQVQGLNRLMVGGLMDIL